jgi:transposase
VSPTLAARGRSRRWRPRPDRIDARVLAELARRQLVPEVWVPTLADRTLLERLLRRMHVIRLRPSAKNRIFGLLSQWGVHARVRHLRQPGAIDALAERGVPDVWRASIAEAVAVIDLLDGRLAPIDAELGWVARRRGRRAAAHDPGRGLAARADLRRGDRRHRALLERPQARRLPRPCPEGPAVRPERADGELVEGRLAAAALGGSAAAQHAWRPQKPVAPALHVRARQGHGNAAKSAVARKVLIAVWHVWARQEPFTPAASQAAPIVPASSGQPLAA